MADSKKHIKQQLERGKKRAAAERKRTGKKLPTTPPKKSGRKKFRAEAKIINVAEDVKDRVQIMKEKLKRKKRKK